MKRKTSVISWAGILAVLCIFFVACKSDNDENIFAGSSTFRGDMYATMIVPTDKDTIFLSDTLGFAVRFNKDESVQFSQINDTLRYNDKLYKAKIILSVRSLEMASTSIDTLRTLSFGGDLLLYLDDKFFRTYPINEVNGRIGSTYMEFRSTNTFSSQEGEDKPYAWLKYNAKKMN